MGLKEKFIRFMYGRNGNDQLTFGIFVVYLILSVLNMFFRSSVLNIIIMLLPALAIFRMLSKNIYKRKAENEKFLKIWYKFEPRFRKIISRFKQLKTHSFHKCPQCKTTLRLPRKRGMHMVICPVCKHKFSINILF